MERVNSEMYLHNGYAICQETIDGWFDEGIRVWAVYHGYDIAFIVPFGKFDLVESMIDNLGNNNG